MTLIKKIAAAHGITSNNVNVIFFKKKKLERIKVKESFSKIIIKKKISFYVHWQAEKTQINNFSFLSFYTTNKVCEWRRGVTNNASNFSKNN